MPKDDIHKQAHCLSPEAVLSALQSTAGGLSSREAAQRLAQVGPNALPDARSTGLFARIVAQVNNVLILVLLGAAAITILLGHLLDAAVILAVVVVNTIIGLVQEGKAQQALDAICGMLAPTASVVRDGERTQLPAQDLVPGDAVLLEAGDRVPADLRVLQSNALQVQEAVLTGESLAVDKSPGRVAADAALGDRRSIAFSGTLVTSGQGRGVVVATGAVTEIGRISGMIANVDTLETPLLVQINRFARWLTAFILSIAALLLGYGHFVRGYPFTELFMAVVGLSVAAIPEGLPAVLTITMAVGVQSMAKRNAIVRRLPAIETLGAVSVICTDKTGTLTRNEMMVARVACADECITVTGSGYEPDGEFHPPVSPQNVALQELARAAALCNDAAIVPGANGREVAGDPMEGALLVFAEKAGVHREARQWVRTDTIPFDPAQRFMATLHHDHEGHGFVFVKGAPETVLAMCTHQRAADGSPREIDTAYWETVAETTGADGQRVLALAARSVAADHTVLASEDVGHLVLLGLVGLIDPPRPEAIKAVAECRAAGIQVKMITGDHAGTARAIARHVGLVHIDNVLTGHDIDALDDASLAETIPGVDVFARTSPEHKLRLVKALQSNDQVVAMTGDGVNDAPALKRADAGVAMGRGGSDAAREAAEIVLADDNFASIVQAIREGRTVYDNIKKVISWTLPTSGGEAAVIVLALLLGTALPVTPVQILWVNLITAVTLGIALAFEPSEPGTMRRPPRQRDAALLDATLVWHIVFVSSLFLVGVYAMWHRALERGYDMRTAQTIAMNTLVVMEIFHLFFIRNIHGTSLTWRAASGTRVVWATVVTVTLAQFAVTYLPPLQFVLGTAPVGLADGVLIVCTGGLLLLVIEIEKQLRLRVAGRRAGKRKAP